MRSQPKPTASPVAHRREAAAQPVLRLKPLAHAIALLMLAGSAYGAQPQAFSSGWFAAKGAAKAAGVARPGAGLPGTPPPLSQQQRANTQLQRSLSTLNNTVAAIAAQQAAQAAGRAGAKAGLETIHNGLGGNGLNVVIGADGKPLFVNAEGPVQTDANGKTLVTIKQTADKAVLNWDTFNIGRNTTLELQQQADWAALNRVNNSTAPSQVQGALKANGTVLIVNNNGIVFSGSSQVNVRNLVAAATDFTAEQFTQRGLYSTNTTSPSFTQAAGKVLVEQGAQIQTHAPATSTAGGGYVLLLGKDVENAGAINTARGQTTLAAGDSFIIKKGYGTDGNASSTTRGNEVSVSGAGQVSNSGSIQAATGDITLAGRQVRQNGVLLSSSSVDARGTLHLNATGSDASVSLGEGSTSAILLDSSNALDSQRAGLITPVLNQEGNVVSADTYRRDQSLVEINSAGTVDFRAGSVTLATGGQVAVKAGQRALLRDGAVIDVSGAVGVKVAMEANSVKVNIQGNEQRDASVNRDSKQLNSTDVWVDVRELVRVPAGTNGYATDRWYTAGGLLEVGGYLGTRNHSVGEWMAQGGSVNFSGADVVTQQGSQINLSGGTLDVQSGKLKQSWLRAANGRLFEVSRAPGDILYSGLYKGYEDHSPRWGVTDYYYNPLIAPRERAEAGYTVGRDAGRLVIGTTNAVLEGQVIGDTFQGDRQVQAAQAGLEGYRQTQTAVARGAELVVGSYVPWYIKDRGALEYVLGANAGTLKNVVLGHSPQAIAAGLDLASVLPEERRGTLHLDSDRLNAIGLGTLKVAATGAIQVDAALQVASGGEITLYGPDIEVNANLTAHGGRLQLGNVQPQVTTLGDQGKQDFTLGGRGTLLVQNAARLDASGLWSNQVLAPGDISRLPYLNGGSVALRSSGDVTLAAGTSVDVSSGAGLGVKGQLLGGKGGDLSLAANANTAGASGVLTLDGQLQGYGVKGGGRMSVQAGEVLISDQARDPASTALHLGGGFFNKGFSAYDITGNEGLRVADGTQVEVTTPVYRFKESAQGLAVGSAPGAALELWTPPLALADPIKGRLTQRQGASLSLQAGTLISNAAQMARVQAEIGQGALIRVDPGQAIKVRSIGQLTVDGTLSAWGGQITLGAIAPSASVTEPVEAVGHGRSIWIGEHALLDVAARASTAVDVRGRHYGTVAKGGSIVVGGTIDPATGKADAAKLFVVVREGARLDASGTQARVDLAGGGPTLMASDGGSISLASSNGLYLAGDLKASAGGSGAAGGTLSMALETPLYLPDAAQRVRQARELLLSTTQAPALAGATAAQVADTLVYGQGRLTVAQVEQGGFDNLNLLSNGAISFDGDMSLRLGQSLSLYANVLALGENAAGQARVSLAAPHVRLAGVGNVGGGPANEIRPTVQDTVSQQAAAGNLSVAAATLLEVRDRVTLGGHAGQHEHVAGVFDRRGFAQAQWVSQGDLRFLAGTSKTALTELTTPGDLHLAAAQIYPATGASARVRAGYLGPNVDFDVQRTLSIGRVSPLDPAQPYSVFGSLSLAAAHIEQGGVLRAPMGNLTLGFDSGVQRATRSVNLLPGSLTSVSAGGLTLPYGGTLDGVTWRYNGEQVQLLGVGGTDIAGNLKVGTRLLGQTLDVQQGAVLDLSGGGALLGAAFVSGRGGSTDARYNPLVQISADGHFTLPGLATNPVYAIVPGVQANVAPSDGERGASQPLAGQQISIGSGVPGLPAGTYTLLPSTYALLPGAFRVEVNGLAQALSAGAVPGAVALRNGSWATAGQLSIAHTGIRDSQASQVIVTPAAVLRRYSQYNETSYADFVRADQVRVGVPRAALEADAKNLRLELSRGVQAQNALNFAGEARFKPAEGGFGATVAVTASQGLEILASGAPVSSNPQTVSLYADTLNALGAARLTLGGATTVTYGQGGNFVDFDRAQRAWSVALREGATLVAPEVFLIANAPLGMENGGIHIEQGASINTLGRGKAAYDSGDGFIYQPGVNTVVAVSNGRLQMLAPLATSDRAPGSILVGQCALAACGNETRLYSEGTIAFATNHTFTLDDAVRYGTRHLALAVGAINVGTPQALAAAAERNTLPLGLTLDQQVMERLLRGDTSRGAPALESLGLTAGQSLNFFGSSTLSTLDSNGKSLLDKLVLSTPAIYGAGNADDVALIQTGNLIWSGAPNAAAPVIAQGAGTGSGTLQVQARRIEFGHGPDTQADSLGDYGRSTLGFANVNLTASERITANHKGSLAVYQARGAYEAGKGYAHSGGNLTISTPLLTGEAGSVNRITVGGDLRVNGNGAANGVAVQALGGELLLAARSIGLDTAVVLPSGKLTLSAEQDIHLGDAARLDLAGRTVGLLDEKQYSWGGDVTLQSRHGNIRQGAGAVIDLSAHNNQGGLLKAVAVEAGAGVIDLQGRILAGSSGYYDAGGTLVPYKAGGVDIRGQYLGDFVALNQRLNDGQVFGARSFTLKQGNLVIGNELKASQINVSVDNGSLTVLGTLDASGERVGSIRLAGQHGLTLAGSALLDAHGTQLRVDSYGKIIDSPNRAIVELNSGLGTLTLADGARIDLRHGTAAAVGSGPGQHDGQARGTLELNAPRLNAGDPTQGDIAIDASGRLGIFGARSIGLNAVARYTDAPVGPVPAASGRPYQMIDQAYLNAKHLSSQQFIDHALANNGLMHGQLAGLNNAAYREAFHLRPGVQILTEGDLVVSGDLDLSGYRYASVNPHTQQTSVYGSGEPGSLVIRAGGNLDIYGSINDGFAPPPATPDDKGWVLTPGMQGFGADVIVPGPGVVLEDGSLFPAGKTLNYALPFKATTLASGTVLAVQGSLQAPLTLPANTVLSAAVRDSNGQVLYAAGTLLQQPLVLATGTLLDAGTLLPGPASLGPMTWPAGVPLPGRAQFSNDEPDGVRLAGSLALKVGALIPSLTDIKLPAGVLSVPLRSVTDSTRSNWAVATMLAEGSQSWSLRLVSGADTTAADSRAIKPTYAGDLTLADTHYGLYEVYEKTIIPGKPAKPGGALYWTDLGAEFGYVSGTPVSEDDEGVCTDMPGACVTTTYVWGDSGAQFGYTPGTPAVSGPDEDMCLEQGDCVVVGLPTPEVPEQVIIGALKRVNPITQHFSVLRTGTGDLDLVAAGNVAMQSLYGIYTAGVSSASRAGSAAPAFDRPRSNASDGTLLGSAGKAYEGLVNENPNSLYAAWYPDQGGNVLLRAGGSLSGDILSPNTGVVPYIGDGRTQLDSANLGNWLWRQGSGHTQGVDETPTSWWINFGTYIKGSGGGNTAYPLLERSEIEAMPRLVGFTGVGTLGGGNLTLDLGSDAGMLARRGDSRGLKAPRSAGLALAVGSTGRVTPGGELLLTGGGDLDVRMGGDLNPDLKARAALPGTDVSGAPGDYTQQLLSLNGVLSNLRGALNLQAGSLGGIALSYGRFEGQHDDKESRAYSPYTATRGAATGGVTLMLGDATANLSTRGDLVLAGAGDPGRIKTEHASAYRYNGQAYGEGQSWFSLWTEHTAINLFSAGGSMTPSVQSGAVVRGSTLTPEGSKNHSTTDGRFLFPSKLSAVAASGSIFLGTSALGANGAFNNSAYSLLLAPSNSGRLALLAGNSIYAGGYAVSQSGASLDTLPTPFAPAFVGWNGLEQVVNNLSRESVPANKIEFSLFAFGANTASARAAFSATPARFYAATGDIVGLRSGELLNFTIGDRIGQTRYEGAGPVWMKAGRDIVGSGTALNMPTQMPTKIAATTSNISGSGTSSGNLFVHGNASDISVVSAGRDIRYSSFNIAGPGTLELQAGRNILMEDRASVTSLGAVVPGDTRQGASIVMEAGVGAGGLDYLKFVRPYLDPASRAHSDQALASQPGKVAKTYEAELLAWLQARFAYAGTAQEAPTYFASLAPEQQRVFARDVYFAELRAGGREYNDVDGPRFGSFLRSRNAIASLLPKTDVAGNPIVYDGDITLYGGAGIHTLFGGDIHLLTPGGQQVFGVEGEAPPSTSGVITQGAGNIGLYAQGSILLGQSRIMTTFGGDIFGWSDQGDINAGRGSKTTVVYTPPKRVYDQWGNVALAPSVPSSGAGIATLAPIAEVPAGDIDLLAPLGTIDAGEAGIRVSGNINLYALQVVNAANIQVQGKASGMPVVAAVNTGAITSASSAATSATQAAEDVARQQKAAARQNLPSVVTVKVLGYGQEPLAAPREGASRAPAYNRQSPVQVLGAGPLSDQAQLQLTEEERGNLTL